jgi:thiol-disulfide isomerase/thioredoxin
MTAVGVWLAVVAGGLPAPDADLVGPGGEPARLSAATGGKPAVVVFVATGCPLANLYAPRLAELSREFGPRAAVLAVAPNGADGPDEVAAFARKHQLPFPVYRDPGAVAAGRLGATRSPEAVVLDAAGRVRYRGRIDDQYQPGMKARAAPSRADLAEAAREVLAGRPVTVPRTRATGCPLDRPKSPAGAPVTFTRDVAPVLFARCAPCHRPGAPAPFSLLGYRQARGWADAIVEVLDRGRMPPWGANPAHGRFANDPRPTDAEKRLLAAWVRAGCPEGDPADLPPAPTFRDDWAIPGPDRVISIPEPESVPAEGVVDYRYVEVDPGFAEDVWVTEAEVRPGNKRVLHHCNLYLRPPGAAGQEIGEAGPLRSFWLAVYVPGTSPRTYPPGMAKRIPAGWRLLFELHYTPTGAPETDRTSVGLTFAKPGEVTHEVATKLLHAEDIDIPPGAAGYRVERAWTADRAYTLLALFPHMHLRGRSFRYTAEYPDGSSEVLLDVPRYDPNWQHRYQLAEPRRLPAGTVVRCAAEYDNSAANEFNPDPAARVRTGRQIWDEMFNGYLDVAVPLDELPEPPGSALHRWALRALAAGGLGLGWMLWRLRRRG